MNVRMGRLVVTPGPNRTWVLTDWGEIISTHPSMADAVNALLALRKQRGNEKAPP